MIRSEAKCDIFAERAYVTFLLNVDTNKLEGSEYSSSLLLKHFRIWILTRDFRRYAYQRQENAVTCETLLLLSNISLEDTGNNSKTA